MTSSIFSHYTITDLLRHFSTKIRVATAIVAPLTLALFPHSAFASDTWGYCVIIDHHGHRGRFTNIFHYPFMVTKYDLKPSADRFKSDTGSGFKAAPDCLVFNDEASAIKQRNDNIAVMHRFGAEAYVMDYNVKYKNYPSTPPPKLAVNPADHTPHSERQNSPTPTAVKDQPRVMAQHKHRTQSPSNKDNRTSPATQIRPHTRLSTQEAIAQAQDKTHRIRLAEERRAREKTERERQRHEREARAREKRARQKAQREKTVYNVVLTWHNKAGKWFACGPVQCIQVAEDTEQQALNYVIGKRRHSIVGSSRYYGCRQYRVAAKAKDTAGDQSEAAIRRRATCRIGKVGN